MTPWILLKHLLTRILKTNCPSKEAIKQKIIVNFTALNGGLAQLARAFDWQSRGHRFDSDILHQSGMPLKLR